MTSDLQEPPIFKLLSFLGTFSTRTDQSDAQMIHSSVLDMFLEDLRKTPPSGKIGGMTISISLSSKEKGYHLLDQKEGSINRMRRTTVYPLSRNEQEKVMSQRKGNGNKKFTPLEMRGHHQTFFNFDCFFHSPHPLRRKTKQNGRGE